MTRRPTGPVVCEFGCGQPVTPGRPGVLEEIIGWAEKRTQGGYNSLKHPRRTYRYAHKGCVEEAAIEGLGAQQETLL